MRGTWFVLATLAGCGVSSEVASNFEIVGHSDLGARGMSSARAITSEPFLEGNSNS